MKLLNTSIILSCLALGTSLVNAAPTQQELSAPQAIVMVQPEVPANYVRWGIPGHVVVTFQINEAGRTTNIRVVETDDMTYARIVKEAVRRWRFEKPEILGVTYRLPVNFTHQGRLG